MKTTIVGIVTALSLFSARAEDGEGRFAARQLSLSMFGGWVDKHGTTFAPGVGLNYFLTPKLGLGVTTFWENYSGTFIDNLAAEGYFRWPLAGLPLAPYGLVSFGYSFETEETFESIGFGAEWRFNDKWGAFADVRYQFNNDTRDGAALRIGVTLVF